jgi:CheY-like chemotaxis protein
MPGTKTRVRTDVDRHRDVSVLIVDDLPVFRTAASEVIRATPGFWLLGEASSGAEGIELVTQHAPDLVLLDVSMPKLDGVGTARLIAQIKRAPITVLMSADQHPDIAADPRAHGDAAFLPKQTLAPRTLQELWATHGTVALRDDQTTPATDITRLRGEQPHRRPGRRPLPDQQELRVRPEGEARFLLHAGRSHKQQSRQDVPVGDNPALWVSERALVARSCCT